MPSAPYNVLFLCTGNSARSIIAEAYLNHSAGGRFKAFSAGSHPTGQVNSYAIEQLRLGRLAVDGLRSKSWDEFATPEAPELHFVFTVCDDAAGETCPVWPGQPITAHWGVPDPARVRGSEEVVRRAFLNAYTLLSRRIGLFTSLKLGSLDKLALKEKLVSIGSVTS
ncbi:MAG: arsenate reductase ArsC [Burkholderiales bacterium]